MLSFNIHLRVHSYSTGPAVEHSWALLTENLCAANWGKQKSKSAKLENCMSVNKEMCANPLRPLNCTSPLICSIKRQNILNHYHVRREKVDMRKET